MKPKNDGFTLLEMVVSIAIVGIVSLVISQVFLTTLRTNTRTEILKDMKQNGEFALEAMVRMIQSAQSVTCVSENSISIINPDDDETTFECAVVSGSTRIASTSAQGLYYLTSENVTMGGADCTGSTLIFTCEAPDGVPSSVTIAFDLALAGTPDASFADNSESFQTSAVMRNAPIE